MLRAGVTTCSDMYFYPDLVARALTSVGMRAVVGIIAIGFPTAYAVDADDYLRKGLQARDALRDEPLVSFTLAPHAPYTVTDETLARVSTLAEELDLPVHMHLHETAQEIDESIATHGLRPMERLDRLGLLSERLIAVHAVHLTDAEIGRLYVGKVKKITDFGAFVEIFPGTDGLLHISELAERRIAKVEDVCVEGDEVLVKCLDVDPSGKIRLSRRAALAEQIELSRA